MIFVLFEVIEKKAAVEHDRVVLLGDLIALGQVCVDVVLAVEFDLGQDAATESKRSLDSLIKALFVEDGEHTWQAQVDKARVRVWLHARRVQRGCSRKQNQGY